MTDANVRYKPYLMALYLLTIKVNDTYDIKKKAPALSTVSMLVAAITFHDVLHTSLASLASPNSLENSSGFVLSPTK